MATILYKFCFAIFGAALGFSIGNFLKSFRSTETISRRCAAQFRSPIETINLTINETTMNSQRTLVFVGVMTSKEFLESRAKATYDTWGKLVPGRIAFFSSEGSSYSDIPVIPLKGVDDRYPPQKKSFMMLLYMFEHYIDKFEWFLRADDDVFVKPDKLEKALRSANSTTPQFIGQAGRGNQQEFGLLSFEYDENFCMGGPGVLMSRETLKLVAPHIKTCLKNLYSTHEDVEVGRCVQKYAKVPCTWNYEMKILFYHSVSNRDFSVNLKNKDVHRALTIHPIKRPPLMYRMYAYYLGLLARDLWQQTLYLHRDIAQAISALKNPETSEMFDSISLLREQDNILGVELGFNRYMPEDLDDLVEWDLTRADHYSSSQSQPKRQLDSTFREGLYDVIREVVDVSNENRHKSGLSPIRFKMLSYGYSRLNTLYGQDLIVNVDHRNVFHVQRSFTETRMREIRSPFDETTDFFSRTGLDMIVFVLPLLMRYETFLRFLNNFEDVVLRPNENAELLICLFVNATDPTKKSIFQVTEHLNQKYKRDAIKIIELSGEFSRGVALDAAVQSEHIEDSDIVFFVNVDIIFKPSTLQKIRLNTIESQIGISAGQVYSPIIFEKYDPREVGEELISSPVNVTIDFLSDYNEMSLNYQAHANSSFVGEENGFFNELNYDLLAIYKCDLVDIKISMFGTDNVQEGVELIEKILKSSFELPNQILNSVADGKMVKETVPDLDVFRSTDDSLVQVFHPVSCERKAGKPEYKACLLAKSMALGSYRSLKEKCFMKRDFLEFIKLSSKNNWIYQARRNLK